MKFIDLFSGIGGFRSGLEKNGHECVAFCEIDKYARQSYKAIHDTEGEDEFHDVTEISNEKWRKYRGTVDIICGGFPCQAFSIAGNRRGFEDTRGTLFFEIARAIKEIEPSYILLENVKGLFSHDKGRTFGTIIQALDELGYIVEWGLFNSKFWGVPQNRERVFILVTRKDVFKAPKLFDLLKQQTEVNTKLIDVLETDVDEKYFLSEDKTEKLILNNDLSGTLNHFGFREVDAVHNTDGVSPTLSTMQGGNRQPKIAMPTITPDRIEKRQNGRRFKEDGEPMFTLTSQDRHGVVINPQEGQGIMVKQVEEITNKTRPNEEIGITIKENGDIRPHRMDKRKSGISELNINHENNASHTVTASHSPKTYGNSTNLRIRKLTPLECWRLQGFTGEQFYKAKNDGVSNSQLYKQAGNSVTVNVIDAIAKTI